MAEDEFSEDFEGADPEELWEAFLELAEEQPILKESLNSALKHAAAQDLVESDPKFVEPLMRSLYLISVVSLSELDYFIEHNEVASDVYQKVLEDFEEERVSDELVAHHAAAAEPVHEKIDDLIEMRKRKIYGDTLEDIHEIQESEKEDKEEIIESIKEPFRENEENDELFEEIDRLEGWKDRVDEFPYTVEDIREINEDFGAVSGDEHFYQKHYAVMICDPEYHTRIFAYEPEFQEYPLRWMSHLTTYEHRYYYRQFKNDALDDSVLTEPITEEYLNAIVDEALKLPFFQDRSDFIEEAAENHKEGRYASSICVLFPQIEAFTWVYAAFLDEKGIEEIFVDIDVSEDGFWNFNPRDYDEITAYNENGNEMVVNSVKQLVSQTALNQHLYSDVVEYFANELFEERNPILHGNSSDFNTEVNSAKKLIFFRNFVEEFSSDLTDPSHWMDEIEQDIDVDWKDILTSDDE
ncbi:hypothetical protein [Natrinema salifodinae]|uniref:Uncharacterized protein n=2 Tax=Halobacteriales TaxID=2235 RepID=A0A1I0PS76_9EURY|nr:hypothetical protein [Natrinema salifodinae]SEW17262.1 hypothetical protein SAMN05216285_2885 [Natrinema salifodinae]